MWNILVSGSTAYDFIMDYNDKFTNHINNDNIHKLSVCFVIDNLKKERWGTWLNIAYNLALLWKKSILMSSVWLDYIFTDFHKENINLDYVYTCSDLLSSSAYITNDNSQSQITAFYPWAMIKADLVSIHNINENIEYAIVSPNKKEAMVIQIKELNERWIKTFFDPGQAIFGMDKYDLEQAMKYSDYLIVNDFEFDLFKSKIWLEKEEIIKSFEKVIITLWSRGSVILDINWETFINPVENGNVLDPTWAWDAYRWWLLRWLNLGFSFEKSAKVWTLLASISVWYYGWQNHFIEKNDFEDRFEKEFWEKIGL